MELLCVCVALFYCTDAGESRGRAPGLKPGVTRSSPSTLTKLLVTPGCLDVGGLSVLSFFLLVIKPATVKPLGLSPSAEKPPRPRKFTGPVCDYSGAHQVSLVLAPRADKVHPQSTLR